MNTYIIAFYNGEIEYRHTWQDEQFIRDCCTACNIKLIAFYEHIA